jgi:hypothetical protein
MFAENPLAADIQESLPAREQAVTSALSWDDVFPGAAPAPRMTLVLVWAPWTAHAPEALAEFQRASELAGTAGVGAAFRVVQDFGSSSPLSAVIATRSGLSVPVLAPTPALRKTGAVNQMPTTLVFSDGVLVDQRLGTQTAEQLFSLVSRGPHAFSAPRAH